MCLLEGNPYGQLEMVITKTEGRDGTLLRVLAMKQKKAKDR